MTVDVALPRPTRFSIGRSLGDGLRIFARNAVWLVALACAARAVVLLVPEAADSDSEAIWPSQVLNDLTEAFASGLTDAMLVLSLMQILRGYRPSVGDVMEGVRYVVPAAIATAILNLTWTALALVDVLWESTNETEYFLRWLGVYAISMVVYVHGAVATQAIVIEKIGPIAGLRRSVRLVMGRRWSILAATMVPLIAMYALYAGKSLLLDVSWELVVDHWSALDAALDYFISALSTGYFAVQTTVFYYYLRREKEGAESGELARVFD